MHGLRTVSVAFAIATAVPVSANACNASNTQTFLHMTLSLLTADAVAAEVEILGGSTFHGTLEARVIRMHQGDQSATRIGIRPEVITSCDTSPPPGQRGVVIGTLRSSSNGLLVIDPVRARWDADRGVEVPRFSDSPASVEFRPPPPSPRF